MCSKNGIGPKTVPCGTPESTGPGQIVYHQLRHVVLLLLEN